MDLVTKINQLPCVDVFAFMMTYFDVDGFNIRCVLMY